MSSSRPISPSPVRPPPHRDFSPPPRVRSPPPFAPVPRVLSPPTYSTSPPPLAGYVSPPPPPILNIQPSTPQSVESTHSAPSPPTTTSTETTAKIPASKSLDAIHEVVETGEGSESDAGHKISSNSSSVILPPTSPQRKPTTGPTVGQLQPLEGQRSMTVEVTSKPPPQLATTDKDKEKISKAEAILKSVKSNDTIKPPTQPKPKKKRSRATNIANTSIPPLAK
jgi:hypothetical protein